VLQRAANRIATIEMFQLRVALSHWLSGAK
jgi:hypothetical protein